jgi:hypothetical protein
MTIGTDTNAAPAQKGIDAVAASMLVQATGPAIEKEELAVVAPSSATRADAATAGDGVSASPAGTQPDDTTVLETQDDELHNDDAADDSEDDVFVDFDKADDDTTETTTTTETTDGERADESGDDDFSVELLGEKDDKRLVSVTVDGAEETVTLADLKRRYAGEGAIDRRLQEATEARTATVKTYETGKQIIETTLKEFGAAMFNRTVPAPDEGLRQSDPTRYLLQRDAYDREGEAIQAKFNRLSEVTKAVDAERTAYDAAVRNSAAIELQKLMPVLKDPKKGPIIREKIVTAAHFCGYTDADIAACTDPKLFRAFAYVAKALALDGKTGVKAVKSSVRTLKPTGGANKPKPGVAQRQQVTAMQRAKQTGSVDDIAMSMLTPAKRKA